MLLARGKVVDTGSAGTLIRFESTACGSCRGCHQESGGATDMLVPPVSGKAVVATLSTNSLIAVLTHSFGLPIAGFVGGASLAMLAGASDGAAALLSLLGFFAGAVFCRQQQMDRIQIAEVLDE